jgi:hypothetical protein
MGPAALLCDEERWERQVSQPVAAANERKRGPNLRRLHLPAQITQTLIDFRKYRRPTVTFTSSFLPEMRTFTSSLIKGNGPMSSDRTAGGELIAVKTDPLLRPKISSSKQKGQNRPALGLAAFVR